MAKWLAERQAAGYEHLRDEWTRLWRYLYPEQLLAAPTVEGQARILADWVVESFRGLAENPPPTRG